jgi:two-component system response regulator NreC
MSGQAEKQKSGKLRILLAEDHEMVREGLRLLVNAQPDMEVIGEAGNGQAAIESARELGPDIIIMDVSMPKMNGLQATEKLKRDLPHVKVLALTRHTDTGFLQQLFRAGASGYVLKQSTSDELMRAVRAIAAGGNYLDPAITRKVIKGYASRKAALNEDIADSLTGREEEVLRLIAWGYSNKEIAAKLNISVKTVEAHKTNLMKKLNLHSRIDIVRYALLKGWLRDN